MEEVKDHFKQSRASRWKNVVLILVMGAILIPLTVYAVMQVVEYRSKALPTEEPKRIEVTNITDTSATVSWVTTSKTIGSLNYGRTTDVGEVALDVRDKENVSGEYSVHYMNISYLTPGTLYYYAVVVGGKEYKQGNTYYQFKTGPTIGVLKTPQPVKGEVLDHSDDAEELIIYLSVQKGTQISNKISTITTEKRYSLDLSNLYMVDMTRYFTDFDEAYLYLTAEGGSRGEGKVNTQIVQLSE